MPGPFERIACFIDQDESSEMVLAEALRLREFGDGHLVVAHVAPEPLDLVVGPYGYLVAESGPDSWHMFTARKDFHSQARRWIEARAERAQAEPVLLSGYPPRAACEFARGEGIDLIVAAAHHGRVRRAMLGGFASYVAYHAPCPVLLMPTPEPEEPGVHDAAGPEASTGEPE